METRIKNEIEHAVVATCAGSKSNARSRYEEAPPLEDSSRRNLLLFLFPSRLPPADNSLFVCIPADFLLRELHFVSSGEFFARFYTQVRISRMRNVIRYFDQVGTFKLDGRGRHVIPLVPSFLPSFLPCVCLRFEVTVTRYKERPSYTIRACAIYYLAD